MRALLPAILLTAAFQQPPPPTLPPAAAPIVTAIVRGRVVAPGNGAPIANAVVSLGGTPSSPTTPRQVYTDAQGRFEFKGLAPGTYGLVAGPSSYQKQYLYGPRREVAVAERQVVEDIELTLARASAIVGRLVDDAGQPVGGVNVYAGTAPDRAIGPSQTSDEFGRFRIFGLPAGSYYIVAQPSGFDANASTVFGLVESYYPGTASRAEATRVAVGIGEEHDAGSFHVLRSRMIRVRGTVLDSHGRAAPANRTSIGLSCTRGGSTSRGPDPQGHFEFLPVTPGSCRLTAAMRHGDGRTIDEFVSQPVTLVDADVDVVLAMKASGTLTGRVVIEGGTLPATATLSIRARAGHTLGGDVWIDTAPVATDGTFAFPSIPGERLLRVDGLGGGPLDRLTLKAVMRGNEDVTDVPTQFAPGDAVRIILAPPTSGIQGMVTGKDGSPAYGVVLLFSEDRRTWVPWSTRVHTEMRAGRDGHYIGRTSPGRYYLVALSWPTERAIPMTPGDIDPTLLEPLVKDAVPVVIAPDEIRVVDLRALSGGGH